MAAMSERSLRVKAIDHVTLVVDDLSASRDFYVGILGMQDVPRPAFSFAGLWFQAGTTQIHLIEANEQSGPGGYPDARTRTNTRNHHLAFAVDDATTAADTLRARGVAAVSGPKARPDGAIQVFVADPDGHLIELCSGPE